jgi:hypothetical protein
MRTNYRYFLLSFTILAVSVTMYAQQNEFEQLASAPKKATSFPLDYKILRPRLEFKLWDNDYDIFYSYLTPAIRKTQASMSYEDRGVVTTFTPNSIMPHAQLDTSTMVRSNTHLLGTWRMIVFRSIRFNDSAHIPSLTYYRLADTLLDDKSKDEAFAIFDNKDFKLYAREVGESRFKKEISTKYKIENERYIMLYKFFKSGAGVSQFGIDEKGYLIVNYPRVIENVKKGEYISYYAVIDQYIFEKVK